MRTNLHPLSNAAARRGFSLLEVLVGLAILTAGILAIAAVFPQTMRAHEDAELLTIAAALAQMKVEEIRRDDDLNGRLRAEIRSLPQPTASIVFINEPRLSYSFSNQSLLYANVNDPKDPRATPGVPRVIIRYAPEFQPRQDAIYELRFN